MSVKVFISYAGTENAVSTVLRRQMSALQQDAQQIENQLISHENYTVENIKTFTNAIGPARSMMAELCIVFVRLVMKLEAHNYINEKMTLNDKRPEKSWTTFTWRCENTRILHKIKSDHWTKLPPVVHIFGQGSIGKSTIARQWVNHERREFEEHVQYILTHAEMEHKSQPVLREGDEQWIKRWRMLLVLDDYDAWWVLPERYAEGTGRLIAPEKILTSYHVIPKLEPRTREMIQEESPWRKDIEARAANANSDYETFHIKSVPAQLEQQKAFVYLSNRSDIEENVGPFDTTKLRRAFFGVMNKGQSTHEPAEESLEIGNTDPHKDAHNYGNSFSSTGLAAAFFGRPTEKENRWQQK